MYQNKNFGRVQDHPLKWLLQRLEFVLQSWEHLDTEDALTLTVVHVRAAGAAGGRVGSHHVNVHERRKHSKSLIRMSGEDVLCPRYCHRNGLSGAFY